MANSEQLQVLKQHFPNCFDKNGAFIPDKLQAIVEENGVKVATEGYSLNWLGKSYARLLTNEAPRTLLKADAVHNAQPDNLSSQNLLIKGDNLEVLKHLKGAYSRQVKMIYIDPPYNTGSDGFVYADDRKFTAEQLSHLAGISEEEASRVLDFTNSKSNSHSAWLTFMYPRLYLARELLRDDGVIFISIDDNEQAQLKMLCDDVFGEENFIECITWNKRIPKNDKGIGNIHEYIFIYVKDASQKHEFVMRKEGLEDIYELIEKTQKAKIPFDQAEKEIRKLYKKNAYDRGITLYNSFDSDYRLFGKINMSWPNATTFGPRYEVLHPVTKKPVNIPDRGWRWKQETFLDAANFVEGEYKNVYHLHDGSVLCNRVWFGRNENLQPSSVLYLDEVHTFLLRSILSQKSDGGIEVESLFDGKNYFAYPKPTSLMKTLIGSKPQNDKDIILDFFAGSGTTAHAVMQLNASDKGNRQFICVQIPEVTDAKSEAHKAGYSTIFDITHARITKAAAKIKTEHSDYQGDLGFKVFETIPLFEGYADEPEELSANLEMFNGDTLTEQDRFNLLLTWAVQDGISLTSELTPVELAGYIAYQGGEAGRLLYFIHPKLSLDVVVELLRRLDDDAKFAPKHLVVWGYGLESKEQREMSEAIAHHNKSNRKGIELDLEVRF